MKKLLSFLIVVVFLSFLYKWYYVYLVGMYYSSADILQNILVGSYPLWGAYIVYLGIKKIHNVVLLLLLISLPVILESCGYAQGNVQTLVTHDCGVTYKLVKAGESLPSMAGACSYKVTIPDYPMQGESKFKSSFQGKVLASVEVSYDYSITDAIAFIGEAKYLGRPNSESDDATNSSTAFETAENSVIDKRIKEVARQLLPNEDIVDFSQADFEDKLLEQVNKMLKPHGIVLNFLSFVPTPDEQTRQAIDVATAMKVYESKGISEVGKATIVARAGATKVETNIEQQKATESK